MTTRKKTGGRDFKPGQSGNPSGRPGLPAEVKEAKKLNRVEVEAAIAKYVRATKQEIEAVHMNPLSTAADQVICSVLLKAIEHGDEKRLDFILNRTIGKVPDKLDATIYPKPTIIEKLDGSVEILGAVMEDEDEK